MQFRTYSDLIGAVSAKLGRSDMESLIPGFILLAEKNLRLKLRNQRDNEASTASLPFVVDQNYIDMPADALWPRLLEIQTNPLALVEVTDLASLTRIQNASPNSPVPLAMAVIGQRRIKLAPSPTTADEYVLYYWTTETEVNESKTAGSFLSEAPALLYYAALKHAKLWEEDFEGYQVYENQEMNELKPYQRYLLRSRLTGGRARVRADRIADDRHRIGR